MLHTKTRGPSLSELFFQLKGWFALGPLWSHQSYNQWYLLVRVLSQFGRGPQCIWGPLGIQILVPDLCSSSSHQLQSPLTLRPRCGLELPAPRVCHVFNNNASELDTSRWECNRGLKTRTTGKQHLIQKRIILQATF